MMLPARYPLSDTGGKICLLPFPCVLTVLFLQLFERRKWVMLTPHGFYQSYALVSLAFHHSL